MDSLHADTWRLILIFMNFLASNNKVRQILIDFHSGKYKNLGPLVCRHLVQTWGVSFFDWHGFMAALHWLTIIYDIPPWRDILYENLSQEWLLWAHRNCGNYISSISLAGKHQWCKRERRAYGCPYDWNSRYKQNWGVLRRNK